MGAFNPLVAFAGRPLGIPLNVVRYGPAEAGTGANPGPSEGGPAMDVLREWPGWKRLPGGGGARTIEGREWFSEGIERVTSSSSRSRLDLRLWMLVAPSMSSQAWQWVSLVTASI